MAIDLDHDLDIDPCLAGGGEAGALMRSIDWSQNPLGPSTQWPRPLKLLVQAMLASRFAMRILWGPEYIFLYNDGYRPVLGKTKHPSAMGSRTKESFAEVWHIVGPMFEKVYRGEASALDDGLLPLYRYGYLEECYFTLSYSPIQDEDGVVRGVLGVVYETTERVLADRRLVTLHDLATAATATNIRTIEEACQCATTVLERSNTDLPFVLLYIFERRSNVASLVAASGLQMPSPAAPAALALSSSSIEWPVTDAVTSPWVVNDVQTRFGEIHAGPYPEAITDALIVPLARRGSPTTYGFLIAGINPRHRLDEKYRAFLDLTTEHVVSSIANAVAYQQEKTFEAERRKSAEEERERMYALFMQAPVAICVFRGPKHVYELANPPYLELVGHRPILHKSIEEALPEAAPSVMAYLNRSYTTGETVHGNEIPIPVERNGVIVETVFNFVYKPLVDGNGVVEGIAAAAFEVTGQVKSRTAAERLSQALIASNRELDQFAYVASHDLKAPLRGISNLSQWIEEALIDKMDDESKHHMTLLRGRVHRLEALIDGILSYSRAGRTRELLQPIDMTALLTETRDLLAPSKDATIVIDEPMPTIEAERVPIQQVFLNLLSNALKHAHKPDVHITINCVDDGGPFYHFAVADNGPGIAPEYQERIWAIFSKLDARDQVEGTGIGLSVVKKTVEMRGGRVAVESVVGHGATFHVYWPKRPTPLFAGMD